MRPAISFKGLVSIIALSPLLVEMNQQASILAYTHPDLVALLDPELFRVFAWDVHVKHVPQCDNFSRPIGSNNLFGYHFAHLLNASHKYGYFATAT